MMTIRKSAERGFADHGWLKTYHTFSFADYKSPEHMRFRYLRVLNEDFIASGGGFGEHPHQNMEILTYVLSGELMHRDSMGNSGVIRAGELQMMTAGRGITHSEANESDVETHIIQVWLFPNEQNLEPSYLQTRPDPARRLNQLHRVVSELPSDNEMKIHQQTEIYLCDLDGKVSVSHGLANGRHAWIQILNGTANINGDRAVAGDGVAVSFDSEISISSDDSAKLILFDMS
jgi:redox-sensitive bicupin YhaK (pirin superfamily)